MQNAFLQINLALIYLFWVDGINNKRYVKEKLSHFFLAKRLRSYQFPRREPQVWWGFPSPRFTIPASLPANPGLALIQPLFQTKRGGPFILSCLKQTYTCQIPWRNGPARWTSRSECKPLDRCVNISALLDPILKKMVGLESLHYKRL